VAHKAPTLLALAALSLSLEVFGFASWPVHLQQASAFTRQEVLGVQEQMKKLQVGLLLGSGKTESSCCV
jgi:outer membrane protein assembly factor BamE (lipoprotein component of BamABCDE complex)